MLTRIMCFVMVLLPLFCAAQKEDSIGFFVNKKQLATTALGERTSAELSKKSSGKFTIKLPYNAAFNRSIVIMNDQRNQLLTKAFAKKCSKLSYTIKELLEKTGGEDFSIYLLSISSDPAVASTMRMAPILVCRISWEE